MYAIVSKTCTCAIAYASTNCLPNLFSQAMAIGAFLQNSIFKFYEDQTVSNIIDQQCFYHIGCLYVIFFSVAETESYPINQPTEWTSFEDYRDLS